MSEKQEKIAQRMSIWQHLKEKGNIPRWFREKVSPEIYGEHMRELRDTDTIVRQMAEDYWPALEESVRESRRSFKLGDYPSTLFYANQISNMVGAITREIYRRTEKLRGVGEEIMRNFYFRDPQSVPRRELGRLHQQRTNPVTALFDPMLVAEARSIGGPFSGVRELFWDVGNVFNPRKRELKVLEKMYRNKMLAQKNAARELVGKSKTLAELLAKTLEDLGNYRASGDVESYLKAVQRLNEKQQEFDNRFTELYNEYFAEFIGPLTEEQRPEEASTEVSMPQAQPEVPPAPTTTPTLIGGEEQREAVNE